MGSLFLYLSVLLICSCFISLYQNKSLYLKFNTLNLSSIFLIFVVVILVILSACRYGIGTDYNIYLYLYNFYTLDISDLTPDGNTSSIEIVYYILCRLGSLIFENYQATLGMVAIFIYSLMVVFLKQYKQKESMRLMFLIYFSLFFAPSWNILRQIMALSVFVISLKYIEQKKFVKYLIYIVIATLCHTSAVFLIFLYFINFKINKYIKLKRILTVAVMFIFPFCFNYIFTILLSFDMFSRYTINYSGWIKYFGNFRQVWLHLPILILVLLFRKKLEQKDKKYNFYVLMYFLEYVSIFMSFNMEWAFRMMYYFMASEIIVVPGIIGLFEGRKKTLVTTGVVIYYMCYFIVAHYIFEHDGIFPYNILWDN